MFEIKIEESEKIAAKQLADQKALIKEKDNEIIAVVNKVGTKIDKMNEDVKTPMILDAEAKEASI